MEKKVKAAAKKTETVANKSLTKINKTVKNINEEVTATLEGVMGDVKTSSKEIRAVVAKSAKEVAKKMNTTKNINKAPTGGKIPRACFTIQELLLLPLPLLFLVTCRLLLTAIILHVINIRDPPRRAGV